MNRGTAIRALLAVCAVFGALTVGSSSAPAAVPCWKALLNDWYDGTINNVYPIPCYHQAIQHLPLDVSVYSSARQDIERALQKALAAEKTGTTVTAITPTTPIPNKGSTGKKDATTTTTPAKKKRSPVSQALRDITPGGPGSFPLPLLILGLLAILLVLAGIGGLIWRRYQGRGGPTPA